MAQSAHAIAAWCIDNPDLAKQWRQESEYLIILETPYRNQGDALYNLHRKANELKIEHRGYYEPDLDDDLTAITFTPSAATQKFLANLPLAGRHEQRLEIIQEIIRQDLPTESFYEDDETGLVDLEWRSEHGFAHLEMGEIRYGMFITDSPDLQTDHRNTRYFNGKMRNLLNDWHEISNILTATLYPSSTTKAQA